MPAMPEVTSCSEERAQVERLLAHSLFSQSKRYGSFLRYVTERALKNSHEPLTERALGVEVFGRSPSYDTDADPIVRVTASELRKRLAQYYDDPAHGDEIRIVVQKGTYAAEFLAPGTQLHATELFVPQAAAAQPPARVIRLKTRWYFGVGLATIVIASAAFVLAERHQPSISELFWAPLLDGAHDVVLSFPQFSDHVHLEGVENPTLTWSDLLTSSPDRLGVSWTQMSSRLVHISDVSTACRLSEFLGSKGRHAILRGEHDLTMRDLREAPAVILGGLNNQWTSRLLAQARFSFGGEDTLRFIRDSQDPASREWKFDAKVPSNEREKDLIIISRLADTVSGRVTVLAGGFSVWGTEAAVQLLTDAAVMEKVLAAAPRKWNARNVQIALECGVVKRESGMPRFLAARYW